MPSEILIVEDDPDTRETLATALTADKHVIWLSDSLLGALSILTMSPSIQVLVLDYNLPGMPLQDFLNKAHDLQPNLGIVLISAISRLGEKAQKHGIKHYLQKPFDFDVLRVIIDKVTPQPSV